VKPLRGELVAPVALPEFADVTQEVLLVVEVIERVGGDAVVADRGEADATASPGVAQMLAEVPVEEIGLRITERTDQSVVDLPAGERPIGAILRKTASTSASSASVLRCGR
jgi:hypothetical protein